MQQRLDYHSGTGLLHAVRYLLDQHGAPAPGQPTLWVAHQGFTDNDRELTFRAVPVTGPTDVVPAVARCEVGRNDVALILLLTVQLQDGALPTVLTEVATDPDALVAVAVSTTGAELLAVGAWRQGQPTVALNCFPGRRDFHVLEGTWVEALRRRAGGSVGKGEPRLSVGEVYGRHWAAQVAAAAGSVFATWRVLTRCPDVDGPGVPVPRPFTPTLRGERDRRVRRREREEHGVKIARTDWAALHHLLRGALRGVPDAQLRSRAQTERWRIDPHMLLWVDAPLWANLLGEALPPLEDSLAVVGRGPAGALFAASLRRQLKRRDWWVEASTPAVHASARAEAAEQVRFSADPTPVAAARSAAPQPGATSAAPAGAEPHQVVPFEQVPQALTAAALGHALVGLPDGAGATWVRVSFDAAQGLWWQHPGTGQAHPWPIPGFAPDTPTAVRP